MPNGKPGDSPYTDMVVHGLDCGEPQLADRLRKLDAVGDHGVRNLVSDLVYDAFCRNADGPNAYQRRKLDEYLTTIERLCAGGAKTQDV